MDIEGSSAFLTTLIDVGGYRLACFCAGAGNPTVILDAGLGDSSEVWYPVQEAVSQFTCVCSYDRAGRGQSDPAPPPRTSQSMVNDLHTLFAQTDIPGPYILVGHSFGGFNARLYAYQYPDEVIGIVLVDSAHPDFNLFSLLPPEAPDENQGICRLRAVLIEEAQQTKSTEGVDLVASAAQIGSIPSLGALPLVVLTHTSSIWREMFTTNFSGLPNELAARFEQAWHEGQQQLLNLSLRSIQIVAQHSGHYIHHDEPELVIDAIRYIVEMVREH